MVANQPVLQLDAGHLGEAERHCIGAVWDAEHDLAARRGLFAGQLTTEFPAHPVDRFPKQRAVGAREIDQLEYATTDRPGRESGQVSHMAVLDPQEIAGIIREAVTNDHEIFARHIVLIRPQTLPKTTSGKVQRALTRKLWQEGKLDYLTAEAV